LAAIIASCFVSAGFTVEELTAYLISLQYGDKLVTIYDYEHGDLLAALLDYDWLDVKGKRVLDIGASIGDTAIMFALRGAKDVVAFEPYPFPYGLAVKNVEVNGLKNVKVVNGAVGGKDGSIRVMTGETTSGDDLKPSQEGVEVPVYSLDRVLEEYGPFDAVKMDCEGCEYEALANSRRIGEVSQVMLEYHYGPEKVVEALRRAGFQVKADRPRRIYNPRASDPNVLYGYAYAWRREVLALSVVNQPILLWNLYGS
jgi:FkbM family methyltransferase